MSRYYQLARLKQGETVFPDADKLVVDLDGVTPGDLVENDVAFRAAVAPDAWFWLSGGGTYLLNERYLLIVRRSLDAKVNPGIFSIFSGRADNAAERADPALMVRELFEELLLYEGDTLLAPRLDSAQPIIDAAYGAMREAGIVPPGPVRELALAPIALPARTVLIRQGGTARELPLAWNAGATNDINVLFLFAADCDLSQLRAWDGEFHVRAGIVQRAERAIYLLDLEDGGARPLSADWPACIPQREAMSPALQFLLDACHAARRE